MAFIWCFQNYYVSLHRLHSEPKRKQKRMGGDAYMEKVSTMALCSLTSQIVSQTKKSVKKQSNCRCSWVCIAYACMMSVYNRLLCGIYIRVWASALLDLDRRAMRDAFEKWDEQLVQQPALFYMMYQRTIK